MRTGWPGQPDTYDHISYMMIFDDAARELASHLPRGSGAGRQQDAEDRKPSLKAEKLASEILAQAPDLVSAFIQTPVPRKNQTRETLERMHNLHQAAKDFWSVFLHTWAVLPESSVRLEGNMLSELTAYLTEDCEDGFNDDCADLEMAIRGKEEALQARKATSSQIPTVSSNVQTMWGEQITQPTATSAHRKGKATSKSVTTESCNDEVKHLPSRPKPRPAQERIAVSDESRSLFTAMYTRCRQKDFRWQQLVSALGDAGMSMIHTGGSAVMFSHATNGSITFHRPHPKLDVNSFHLRCFRKRLRKWFGWDANTFVEREHWVQVLIDAIGDVSRAEWITERIVETADGFGLLEKVVRRGRPLPQAYDKTLGTLRSLLEAYYSTYEHKLPRHMAHSSVFQSSFSWSNEEIQYGIRTIARLPTAQKPKRSEDALFWNILHLSNADPEEPTCDRNFHLSYINELVRSEE
ncbi:hypothetical protein LTR22_018041 [Elasticomyces elasticus]|nr:hypothetical protein LTR22_018041 [Elasticomyces elasticus]KAK4908671.1 hypothetical protein LTR49_022483 [Elasticomyces elasticus]